MDTAVNMNLETVVPLFLTLMATFSADLPVPSIKSPKFATIENTNTSYINISSSNTQSQASSTLSAARSRSTASVSLSKTDSPLDGLRTILRLRAVHSHPRHIEDAIRKHREYEPFSEFLTCQEVPLRSIIWRIFLLFRTPPTTKVSSVSNGRDSNRLPPPPSPSLDYRDWISVLETSRDDYTNRKGRINSHAMTTQMADFKHIISQDVARCMLNSSIPYFSTEEAKVMMLEILEVYVFDHMDIGYKQGMHDILAVILHVVRQDALQGRLPSGEKNSGSGDSSDEDVEDVVAALLDERYIEHDAFTLFNAFMSYASPLFMTSDSSAYLETPTTTGNETFPERDPIFIRINNITESQLSSAAPDLKAYLDQNDITVNVFLFRWMRMLFAHEFPIEQVLPLWDSIFAEDLSLNMLDDICLLMILRLRERMLDKNGTTSNSQRLLSHYPSFHDVDGENEDGDGNYPALLVYQALKLPGKVDPIRQHQNINANTGTSDSVTESDSGGGSNQLKVTFAKLSSKYTESVKSAFPTAAASVQSSSAIRGGREVLEKAIKAGLESDWGTNVNKAVSGVVDGVLKGLQTNTPNNNSDRDRNQPQDRRRQNAHPLSGPVMKLQTRLLMERKGRADVARRMEEQLEKLLKVHSAVISWPVPRDDGVDGLDGLGGSMGYHGVIDMLTEAMVELQTLQAVLEGNPSNLSEQNRRDGNIPGVRGDRVVGQTTRNAQNDDPPTLGSLSGFGDTTQAHGVIYNPSHTSPPSTLTRIASTDAATSLSLLGLDDVVEVEVKTVPSRRSRMAQRATEKENVKEKGVEGDSDGTSGAEVGELHDADDLDSIFGRVGKAGGSVSGEGRLSSSLFG